MDVKHGNTMGCKVVQVEIISKKLPAFLCKVRNSVI